MDLRDYYVIPPLLVLLAALPLLNRLSRALAAPWRALAQKYPGPALGCTDGVCCFTARLRGGTLPFALTRPVRIRRGAECLALSVLGPDFKMIELEEIVIPRSAIKECTPCDFLIRRQKLVLADAPVTLLLYGRGALFVRSWWNGAAK